MWKIISPESVFLNKFLFTDLLPFYTAYSLTVRAREIAILFTNISFPFLVNRLTEITLPSFEASQVEIMMVRSMNRNRLSPRMIRFPSAVMFLTFPSIYIYILYTLCNNIEKVISYTHPSLFVSSEVRLNDNNDRRERSSWGEKRGGRGKKKRKSESGRKRNEENKNTLFASKITWLYTGYYSSEAERV